MPAPAKLTRRRANRLLELVESGVSVAEASRAVRLSRKTIYKHARADELFDVQLKAARAGSRSIAPPVEDWRAAAARLEANDPLRWSLPGAAGDAFDFDPGVGDGA
jgi:hypothetical protein